MRRWPEKLARHRLLMSSSVARSQAWSYCISAKEGGFSGTAIGSDTAPFTRGCVVLRGSSIRRRMERCSSLEPSWTPSFAFLNGEARIASQLTAETAIVGLALAYCDRPRQIRAYTRPRSRARLAPEPQSRRFARPRSSMRLPTLVEMSYHGSIDHIRNDMRA